MGIALVVQQVGRLVRDGPDERGGVAGRALQLQGAHVLLEGGRRVGLVDRLVRPLAVPAHGRRERISFIIVGYSREHPLFPLLLLLLLSEATFRWIANVERMVPRWICSIVSSFDIEGVSLAALHIYLRYELVIDVPRYAPWRMSSDGRVAAAAARGPDARREVGDAGQHARRPRARAQLVQLRQPDARVVALRAEVQLDVVSGGVHEGVRVGLGARVERPEGCDDGLRPRREHLPVAGGLGGGQRAPVRYCRYTVSLPPGH